MSEFIDDCEKIDAAIFTGDHLHHSKNIKDLQEFKTYLERWGREIALAELYLKETYCGQCVICGTEVFFNEFKDEISKKEFAISRIWQTCQDKIFDEKPETEGGSKFQDMMQKSDSFKNE